MEYFFSPFPKEGVSERILMWLPLTLFFPVGFMYAGLFAFWISWVLTGDWENRWDRLIKNPITLPILLLCFPIALSAILNKSPLVGGNEFFTSIAHYQVLLFFLPFITLSPGDWLCRMERFFLIGALVSSILFFLNTFHFLPNISIFKNYIFYEGNKSILLGILISLAACWVLQVQFERKRIDFGYLLLFIIYFFAVVFLTKTRTALFLLILGILFIFIFNFRWGGKSFFCVLIISFVSFFGVNSIANQPRPETCVHQAIEPSPLDLLKLRAICTVQQIKDFGDGRPVRDTDGMRFEIFQITMKVGLESPVFGNGAGSWMPMYKIKAKGLSSEFMTTPHNDFLLYFCEFGLVGLGLLLIFYFFAFSIALRLRGEGYEFVLSRSIKLFILIMYMFVGGGANAILRDGVFSFAFLILLSIPLIDVRR